MIEFTNSKLVVNTTTSAVIQVTLKKTGVSTKTTSVNVLFAGADIFSPSAEQYNDIKKEAIWLIGEQGEKTVSIPVESSGNPDEYLLATIDDILGDTIGAVNRAYILLSKVPTPLVTEKFSPTAQGNYVSVLVVTPTGFSSSYTKEADLHIATFVPNTPTTDGVSGLVPGLPAGILRSVLTDKGWSSTPEVNTAEVGDNDFTVANTEFVTRGLEALDSKLSVPFTENTATTVGAPGLVPGLPIGTDPLVLTNNGWSSTPRVNTPLVLGGDGKEVANTKFVADSLSFLDTKFTTLTSNFTGSTATTPGIDGTVPAPPASVEPLLLTNSGWSDNAQIKTADLADSDKSIANTSFVQQLVARASGQFNASVATINGRIDGVQSALTTLGATVTTSIAGINSVIQGIQTAIASLQSGVNQPGMGMEWHGTELPSGGWLWQDDSFYNPSDYPRLFAVIGYSKGRSGDMFRVSNRQGRVAVAAGQGDGLSDRTVNDIGGAETVTLTLPEIPVHGHTATSDPHNHAGRQDQHSHPGSQSSHTHRGRTDPHTHEAWVWDSGSQDGFTDGFQKADTAFAGENQQPSAYRLVNGSGTQLIANSSSNITIDDAISTITIPSVAPNVYVDPATSNVNVQNVGGGLAHENMQPFTVINYIIKY